jgi:PTH1 family peptidyl-tRNA hydrolase
VVWRWLSRLLGHREESVDPLAGVTPETTWLVVGLGNPGEKYAETRHNVGFVCLDLLAERYTSPWRDCREALDSLIAVARADEQHTLVFAKPQTFMNRSGGAVAGILERLGLPAARALVVYDDMDLPLGSLRLRERGSPGTHNGMRSVVASLNSDRVARLRIGIGQSRPGQATDHVLGEFGPDERDAVQQQVARAADAALAWAIDGAPAAMNRYNKS